MLNLGLRAGARQLENHCWKYYLTAGVLDDYGTGWIAPLVAPGGDDKAQPFWRVLAEVTVILPLLLLVPELPK